MAQDLVFIPSLGDAPAASSQPGWDAPHTQSPSPRAPLTPVQSWDENKHIQELLSALTLGLVLLTATSLPVLGRKQKVPELLQLQDIHPLNERDSGISIQGAAGLQQCCQAFISLQAGLGMQGSLILPCSGSLVGRNPQRCSNPQKMTQERGQIRAWQGAGE